MEGWELLFEVRYHFWWPEGGRNGQNCPNFIREYPVGSSRKEKILTKIGWQVTCCKQLFSYFSVGHLSLGCCLLYTSPSPRDYAASRMPSSA